MLGKMRLGPDLSNIGNSRAAAHLRQALTEPNADVRERYWLVSAMQNGKRVEGFLMNEDTYTVQFIGFRKQLHSLAKSTLTDYQVKKVSKMPSFSASMSPLRSLT